MYITLFWRYFVCTLLRCLWWDITEGRWRMLPETIALLWHDYRLACYFRRKGYRRRGGRPTPYRYRTRRRKL